MNEKVRAHFSLIGANLIFGITYAVARHVIPDYLPPFSLVFVRILGACILFWITGFFLPPERINRKDFPRVLLAAVFGVAINQSFFLNGLSRTSPIDAAIIMTATPILVLVIARIILREPITLFKIFGIAAGATGALLLIVYNGKASFGSTHALGNSMIVVNATSYALFLVIIKPLLSRYRPVTLMKWIFLFGLLLVSPPGIPATLKVAWNSLPADIVVSILFVVMGTTFFAYLLNNYSLQYVKPITVSIYIYSQPVVASVAALIMGQDVITLLKVLSAFLVFIGVYFVSYSSSRTGDR